MSDKGRYILLAEKGDNVHRIRVQFAKLGKARFLSHLELVTLFSRSIRRAGIPIRFSEGFHPLPKVVFSPALPVGMESIAEYVDLEINGNTDSCKLKTTLSCQLPNWFKVLDLSEIPLNFPSISDIITGIEYALSLENLDDNLTSYYDLIFNFFLFFSEPFSHLTPK